MHSHACKWAGEGREGQPVGERGDDQAGRVAEVLVRVLELSITDVGKTVLFILVPSGGEGCGRRREEEGGGEGGERRRRDEGGEK